MRCSGTQSSIKTSSRMRYGTGGATTPRKTVPCSRLRPSTENSRNQPHHEVKQSKRPIVAQSCVRETGNAKAPSYSMTYAEPVMHSRYADATTSQSHFQFP